MKKGYFYFDSEKISDDNDIICKQGIRAVTRIELVELIQWYGSDFNPKFASDRVLIDFKIENNLLTLANNGNYDWGTE